MKPWSIWGNRTFFQTDHLGYAHFVSIDIGVFHHFGTPAKKLHSAHPRGIKWHIKNDFIGQKGHRRAAER